MEIFPLVKVKLTEWNKEVELKMVLETKPQRQQEVIQLVGIQQAQTRLL